jgi:hypothetical protein
MRALGLWLAATAACALTACSTSSTETYGTSAEVWLCTDPYCPRDQAQVIEVVQDTGTMAYQTIGHVRAGGNAPAWNAMERMKVEARRLGADALTNVHRVTGCSEAIYEGDAIAWLPR